MAGLTVIAIATAIALFGSLVRPDKTPNANDQNLPLSKKKPGFEVKMLKVQKNQDYGNVYFWNRMLFGGIESAYRMVPIWDYKFAGTHIIIEEFTGSNERRTGPIDSFRLENVLYPINTNLSKSQLNNIEIAQHEEDVISFYDISGELISENILALRDRVTQEHIVRKRYWLGTDSFGRDLLSRLMAGTIVSLAVGFISVFISLVIGITLGAIGGYFRGWVDDIIMWLINVVWSIPTLLLVIAITFALGKGFWQIFVAVGLTMWVEVARVIRGQVISIREKEYIEAGRALGFNNYRIISKHVLPNAMGPVIVISAANFAAAILIESGLSFLGIGLQPPMASWGRMIKNHYGYIMTDGAYLAIFPGLAIILMVLAFMLVGNGLRDALDAKTTVDPNVGNLSG